MISPKQKQLLACIFLYCQYSQSVSAANIIKGESSRSSSSSSSSSNNTSKNKQQQDRELQDLPPSRKAPPIFSKDLFKFARSEEWKDLLISPQEETASPVSATTSPTSSPTNAATYVPGKLTAYRNGLLMSEGLNNRIIAVSGQPMVYFNGALSTESFHAEPDGAAVYVNAETGGWTYVSNSESMDGEGGVGAIYFDKDGNVVNYKKLLGDTTRNCSGGKTPWNTWVSCEEYPKGKIFQVDPMGEREPQEMTMGMDMGFFESFSYDIRNEQEPHFFVTEDWRFGALRRFTPTNPNWDDPWTMLHAAGTLEWLVLAPTVEGGSSGTYRWTTNLEEARENAENYYRFSEGMDVYGNDLYFVSKTQKEMFILNLDTMRYEKHSTVSGLFDGQPDQMARLINDNGDDLLYFCEELGDDNGIHARDPNGWFFTIAESPVWIGETSGLSFNPDGTHMYFSYQRQGLIYDVWREDGLPFYGKTLDVNYHGNVDAGRRKE